MPQNKKSAKTGRITSSLGMSLLFGLTACSSINTPTVITSTATTIGVELGAEQATNVPTGVLGYRRAELAVVPTNKGSPGKKSKAKANTKDSKSEDGIPTTGNGARDTANVLMELRHDGIFSSGAGIYQRLAVGDIAVQQPGAALLFAKDKNGASSTEIQKYVAQAQVQIAEENRMLDLIIAHVATTDSSIDAAKLSALLDKAATSAPSIFSTTVNSTLKGKTTLKALREELLDMSAPITPLYDLVPH